MQTLAPATAEPRATVPPLAWRAVGSVAAVVALLLLATSGRYGYFGDELYFLSAGRHLAWGYADQPPLLPVLARVMDTLFPGSLVGLRLPAIGLTVLGLLASAQLTRELGGRRYAQLATAGIYAVSPFFLVGAGHTLATHSVDAVLWVVVCWLVVRWVRLRDDRLLLAAGVVTAVDLQAKLLIPVFWIAVLGCALLVGPRRLPTRPLLWVGGLIAVVSLLPNLWWQSRHGWPEREMAAVVAGEVGGGRAAFLLYCAAWTAGPLGAVVFGYGLWRLFRSERLRPYRFLALAVVVCIGLFWVSHGRPLYVAGVLPLGWAAATVELQDREWARRLRWLALPAMIAALGLTLNGLPIGLPLSPLSTYADQPYDPMKIQLNEVGWPELAGSVEQATRALSPEQRAHAVIITQTYWDSSAIERFGHDLPPAYSASRGAWYFGAPPESARTVVYVGADPAYLHRYFADVRPIGRVDNHLGINNGAQGAPIWLCERPLLPWSQAWPQLRHMTFV